MATQVPLLLSTFLLTSTLLGAFNGAGGQESAGVRSVLELENVVIEKNVPYGKAGDRELLLDILRPAEISKDPLPVIVFVHGGAWRAGNKGQGHLLLYPYAASGDYFTVSVGYRLSGEAKWPAQIHDCKAAIRWLIANAKSLNVDPNRIGAWGGSAGGHLVSLLGTTGDIRDLEGNCGSPNQSSRVKCVVDFCGTSDLIAQREVVAAENPTSEAPTALDQLMGGRVLDEKREQAKEASPATYATRDDATFLIMHGTNDQVVPLEQAEILHQALRQAKADSTFVKIIDGGHGFLCPAVSDRVSDFFAKHLLGQDVEVSAEPIAAPDAAARKELSRVIGTWKGPNTTIVWRRCIKDHCVAGSTIRDDGTQTYASLISIDPTSGGLIDHGISTWTNGEIHYTELSETQWRGKTRYIGNDGTVFTGDIVLEWNGTDEFKTTTTNRLINGIIPQDDIVSVFRRAPDEPELDNE